MIYTSLTLSEQSRKLSLTSTDPKLVDSIRTTFVDAIDKAGSPDFFNVIVKSYTGSGDAFCTALVDSRVEDGLNLETMYIGTIRVLCEAKYDILGATETNDSKTIHFKYSVS